MTKKQVDWEARNERTEFLAFKCRKSIIEFASKHKHEMKIKYYVLNYPPRFFIVFTFFGVNKVTDNCLRKIQSLTTFIALQGFKHYRRDFGDNEARYMFWLPFEDKNNE